LDEGKQIQLAVFIGKTKRYANKKQMEHYYMKKVATIAGSDATGGGGLEADHPIFIWRLNTQALFVKLSSQLKYSSSR
jgi:hypothetical protein